MPKATRTGIRGLYRDADGRYRIDLRYWGTDGRQHRHKEVLPPGTTAAAAKLRAQSILNLAVSGVETRPRAPVVPKLSEAFTQYLTWVETNRPKALRDRTYMAKAWVAAVGDVTTDKLGPALVEVYKAKRIFEGAAPATVNRGIAMLKHMTGLAARSGWGWIDRERAAQLREVTGLKEPPGRQRPISTKDLERLLAVLAAPSTKTAKGELRQDTQRFARRIVQAALLTGCRLGELVGLLKTEVDLTRKRVDLSRTKSGKRRELVITAPLEAVFKEAIAESEAPQVFVSSRGAPYTVSGFSRHWQRVAAKAGCPDVTFHDLRRHVGTVLINSGERLEVVSKLLGHSNVAVTQRSYAHLTTEATAGAFEKLTVLPTVGSPIPPALPPGSSKRSKKPVKAA
jgi:integrase